MKKILFTLLPLILSASQDSLQKKIELLENEISTIKQQVSQNSYDIEEGMPILEEVEKKNILDVINFSPELTLRFDKMKYKIGKTQGEDTKIYNHSDSIYNGEQRRDEFSKDFDVASLIRFKLKMSAKIDNTLSFNGSMIFMNSSQSHQRLCILSRDIKSAESSSVFDVERAYIDYTPNRDSDYASTFSFGLLPTTGGTPMQFAQNTKRKSMFPALVFDMNTYGMILTQKFTNDTFARAILAKAYTLRANFYPYQCNRENIDNANIAGIYFDKKINFLGSSLLSFGVNMLQDFKAHPYLGPDVGSSDSHILGDIFTYGIGLDIQKVANTDTTIFIHTALSNPNSNNKSDDYQIVATPTQTLADGKTLTGLTGFSEASYAKGQMIDSNGHSVYLGTNYYLTDSINFGAEYNYGSKYWFSATQGAEDMYNKLAIRGSATEIYSTWKFHKNVSAKLGYITMKEKYTGSGWHFGEPAKKDATQDVGYLSLKAKF